MADVEHGASTASAHGSGIEHRISQVLEIVERVLIYCVAFFLILLAVLALIDTITLVAQPLFFASGGHPDYSSAIAHGIDSAFLTVILLELLHTVLSRGPLSLQLQEFLVIGITSAVRHSLEVAVASNSTTAGASGEATNPRDVVIDLGLNALVVLILVAALWLVRQQVGPAADERSASEQLEHA